MSKRTRQRLAWAPIILAIIAAVSFDLSMTHSQRSYINLADAGVAQAGATRPMVALATSLDLQPAVPLDSPDVTYDQVKELVYLALDRDVSEGSLSNIISTDDWVGIKVNMVSAPLEIKGRKIGGFWNGAVDGIPHWGSVSDLRVTKALIAYLIERIGPRRVSIMEGSGEIARTGSPYFDSYDIDGWTITWDAFDDLSYVGIVEDANASQSRTLVDIIDLNDDEPVLTPVPGGGLQLLGGQKRNWAYEDFKPGYGTPRGEWYVPKTLLEVDKLIDQATLKTTAPGITVFMKNYVGTVAMRGYGAGPVKSSVIDNVAIMSGYMDLVRIRPADYCLGAGFWSSDGWYGGTVDINHNIVIAGGNMVASEAVAARVMGFNPRDLQQILLARDLGLGSFEERDYDVVGADPSQLVHRFPGNRAFKPSGFQEFLMLGPFDEDDMEVDLLGGEALVRPAPRARMAGKTWWEYRHRPGYPEPYTDFSHLELGSLNDKTLYAFTYIESDRPQEGRLKFGSDGPARVWLNGEQVLERYAGGGYTVDDGTVRLRAGLNTVMVKLVGNRRGAGFGLSITDGSRMLTDIRQVLTDTPTAVTGDLGAAATPLSASLSPGYPNPFNATVTIPFTISQESHVRITVLNIGGQTVRTLWNRPAAAGMYQVQWNGRDDQGGHAASGTYLIKMDVGAGDAIPLQKVTLLK